MVNKDLISMSSQLQRVLVVESAVPYSAAICEWLQFHSIHMNQLVGYSSRYERAYLAWEAVRKVRNPFFIDGTGFEGYYVGQGLSAEEVIERLLSIGRHILESNYRLYRYNFSFRARLAKTLFTEANDPQAMDVLAAQFGAALGKLRCNLLTNERTQHFQTETYLTTAGAPAIWYTQRDHLIIQNYTLQWQNRPTDPQWNLSLETLVKPRDADAFHAVKSIGKFGHPLVRSYLDKRTSPFTES